MIGPDCYVIGCSESDLRRVVDYRHPSKQNMFDLLQLDDDEQFYSFGLPEAKKMAKYEKTRNQLVDSFFPKTKKSNVPEMKWKNKGYQKYLENNGNSTSYR